MRSLLARIALAGTFGIAIAGCGTQNGTSLPVGAFPNGAGGGPPNVSNQAPPPGIVPGKSLIDVFTTTKSIVGFNTAATDAASANDYGTDPQVADSGPPPVAPGASHLVTFSGNNTPLINLKYNPAIGPLTIPPITPGQIVAQTYGAIVLHAPSPLPKLGALSPTSLFVEIVGGSPLYDIRVNCTVKPGPVPPATTPITINTLVRYVCPLPSYGSPSTTGVQQPVVAGAIGAFDPIGNSVFYVGETFGLTATSTAATSTLNLDYVYAEQGVL